MTKRNIPFREVGQNRKNTKGNHIEKLSLYVNELKKFPSRHSFVFDYIQIKLYRESAEETEMKPKRLENEFAT